MGGLTGNGVWDHVTHPEDTLVVGTKTLYKQKICENSEVEKYKQCRLVAQGFRQGKGLHYQETLLPTPAAVEDWKLRHVDVEQAFLQANRDDEIYIDRVLRGVPRIPGKS